MRRLTLILVSIWLSCIIPAQARIINIPADYSTIQGGIDASSNGDTVLAQPGTYHDRLNYNGHNITVASLYLTTGDVLFIENTIIDAESLGIAVIFESGEDSTATLEGFTIQNGYNWEYEGGGGIRCFNSSPKILHNIIKYNTASWGGGIELLQSSAFVAYNLIYNNSGSDGSGLESENSNATILGCTFTRNKGASINIYNGSITIINTILWGNSYKGISVYGYDATANVSYSLLDEEHPGDGNIVGNPLFIDASTYDFNVCSLSPCVNGGDPNILDPDGTRSDIGYYFSSHPACPNGDRFVVSTTGNDSTGDGSMQNPLLTIQRAIDIAHFGDTVLVQPGQYNENIAIIFENITLTSNWIYTQDSLDIQGTIIDGGHDGSVIYLDHCDSTSAITGLTIQHGLNNGGGGIRGLYADTRIDHNRIVSNKSRHFGGGIYSHNSHSLIADNFIAFDSVYDGNWARGGGIFCSDSEPQIRRNIIYRNWTSGFGAGIQMDPFGEGVIANNVIVQNHTEGNGAGIACDGSSTTISFNVIYGNRADGRAGAVFINSCTPVLLGDIIWANIGNDGNEQFYYGEFSGLITSYCDIQGGWPGEGNIDIYPRVRSLTHIDYRLQSTQCGDIYTSQCIDAGPPDSTDSELHCEAGLGSSRSDMGAYGGGGNLTGIANEQAPSLPSEIVLSQNYPNPFNSVTTIQYYLPEPSVVTLEIYDLLGRKIDAIVKGNQVAGQHMVSWNAKGKPSGVYFYRLKAGDFSESKEMLLVK
jgi:hypothetical protein